jgi:WS/DGAT/MGAT family acyltransferase
MLPSDSAWLALDCPANPMTITVLMRVEGLTAERLWDFLSTYWLAWERFRSQPVHRHSGWWWEEDPVFSLRHHMEVHPEALDESELQDWVSARLNQALPAYRPRWKFWLLPNAPGGAALVLRIHHCYADGLSLMGVFQHICTASPRQMPVLYGAVERSDIGRWRDAAKSWLAAMQEASGPVSRRKMGTIDDLEGPPPRPPLEKAAVNALRLVNEVSQFLIEPEDSPSHLKAALMGRRVCRWSGPVPLASFRTAARQTGSTINDVLLACVTGAVRRCLEAQGEMSDEAILHAAVPVDIRSRLPEGIQPEACMLGNYFGTVFVPLPVDGESPLERLYRVKHETRRLKKSWQPAIAWGLTSSAGFVPQCWRDPLADMFCRKASAVVSNVPGAAETRYLAGCEIREQMFWVPQAGDIGLGVSIISYAGQVQFGVVADEAVMPDPAPFLAYCLEALSDFTG